MKFKRNLRETLKVVQKSLTGFSTREGLLKLAISSELV